MKSPDRKGEKKKRPHRRKRTPVVERIVAELVERPGPPEQPPPPEIPGSTIDRTEELLCMGLSPSRVRRMLIDGQAAPGGTPVLPSIPEEVAGRCIDAVYDRWDTQSMKDAPYRRERVIRMAENFYTKAVAEEQFTAATAALQMLGRMSGAFVQHDPNREALIAAMGEPPDDPTMALVYAQKCMMFALREVVTNATIDPERRLRWISDLGAKIGITHAKTLIQHKLDDISSRVLGPSESNADEMEDGSTLDHPATSRFRPDRQRH